MKSLEEIHPYISIHALLAESDNAGKGTNAGKAKNFYPRSPCGERPTKYLKLLAGTGFLSTLSLRRATMGERA